MDDEQKAESVVKRRKDNTKADIRTLNTREKR